MVSKMSRFIALRSLFIDFFIGGWLSTYSSRLKQQALLFDQIGIRSLQDNILLSKGSASMRLLNLEDLSAELEWLQENGIIFDLRDNLNATLTKAESSRYFTSNYRKAQDELWKSIKEGRKTRRIVDKAKLLDMDKLLEQESIHLRSLSVDFNILKEITAITALPFTDYTRKLPNTKKSDVAQIVISKLPIPDDMTPWEQIIDYRNDEENQKNLLDLRRWIRKISTENLSTSEIEDELQWLMNEFQRHMRIHKMKANTETLEVLVKAPLEIIEDLIKLKFSKIPEPFFALKKRQINLMEAELNAPGREMAYIIKARDTFQSQE